MCDRLELSGKRTVIIQEIGVPGKKGIDYVKGFTCDKEIWKGDRLQ